MKIFSAFHAHPRYGETTFRPSTSQKSLQTLHIHKLQRCHHCCKCCINTVIIRCIDSYISQISKINDTVSHLRQQRKSHAQCIRAHRAIDADTRVEEADGINQNRMESTFNEAYGKNLAIRASRYLQQTFDISIFFASSPAFLHHFTSK